MVCASFQCLYSPDPLDEAVPTAPVRSTITSSSPSRSFHHDLTAAPNLQSLLPAGSTRRSSLRLKPPPISQMLAQHRSIDGYLCHRVQYHFHRLLFQNAAVRIAVDDHSRSSAAF
jgi:hypothetical protein